MVRRAAATTPDDRLNDMEEILISILIATKNRASSLSRTLDSVFTASNISRSDWELIIADNGSSDDTPATCRAFAERFPEHFRFLYEDRGGKSCALNEGVQICRGAVLALIDDDVICEDAYLDGIRAAYAANASHVVQGRVKVDYAGKVPAWFDDHFESLMCKIDLGDRVCELQREFWGLNVVLPVECVATVGGFCPELGAGALGFAEDAEFSARVRKAGYRFMYDPGIVVRHQIPSQRMTPRYVLRRSYAIGRSFAFYQDAPKASLWRYSAYIAKTILRTFPRFLLNVVLAQWNPALRKACDYLSSFGFIYQQWAFRLRGRPVLTTPLVPILRREHRRAETINANT